MAVAMGGSKIRNARMPAVPGTLGCTVVARDGSPGRYLLSAGHVLSLNGFANQGDPVEYLDPESGTWIKIAEFERCVRLNGAADAKQLCDAGIARITRDDLVSDSVGSVGIPWGLSGRPFRGQRVKFFGATSGFRTNGIVHSPGNAVDVVYPDLQTGGTFSLHFSGQVLYGTCSGDVWGSCTDGGDSGALVLDHDDLALGLHLAVTVDEHPLRLSICSPIEVVLEALQVRLPSVTTPPPAAGVPATVRLLAEPDEIGRRSHAAFGVSIRSILEPHNAFGGVQWALSKDGLVVDGRIERTAGALVTVPRVWGDFGALVAAHATAFRVPAELVVATICTESRGNARAFRTEPGWVDDASTPNRVSAGLMQTLISSARSELGDASIDRDRLFDPDLSIRAGTSFIARQGVDTDYDPPCVACAYNAGSLRLNASTANRWRMRQHPIGTGQHADRFVAWFNDCVAFFREEPGALARDVPSFHNLFRS